MKTKIPRHRLSYFQNIFFSILSISLIIIIFFVLFFYFLFSDTLQERLYHEYEYNLFRAGQSFDSLLNEGEQMFLNIALDAQTDSFLTRYTEDSATHYLAFLNLGKLVHINPYICSMGIYNCLSGDMLSVGEANFSVEEAVSQLKPYKQKQLLYIQAENSAQPLLTLSYSQWDDHTGEGLNHVFINFDGSKIAQRVLGETSGNSFILDSDGKLLLAFLDHETLPGDIFPQIKSHKNGTSLEQLDDEEYAVSQYISEDGNYRFISLKTYQDVVGSMKTQRNLILFTSVCVFIFCLVLVLLISRKLYRPLGRLAGTFRSSKYAVNADEEEFSLISGVYGKVIEDIRQLEERNSSYLPRLKEDFLLTLLTEGIAEDKIDEKKEAYGIRLDFTKVFISALHIDHYFREDQNEELVINRTIGNLLLEFLEEHFITEAVSRGSDTIAILASPINSTSNCFPQLVESLRAVRNKVVMACPVKITISIGGFAADASECAKAYREALYMGENRFIFGYNRVLYREIVSEQISRPMSYPVKLINEILSSMKADNFQAFEDGVDSFIETISAYTALTARMVYLQLYLNCMQTLQSISAGSLDEESAFSVQTLEEGKLQLKNMFSTYQKIITQADGLKNSRHYKEVEKAKAYIQHNLADTGLSVESISDSFGYSSNYFSRIFKTIVGCFIGDYIRQARILKAQELLATTAYDVGTIAASVGFPNANYFYTAFKKETGLTPAAYRSVKEWQ